MGRPKSPPRTKKEPLTVSIRPKIKDKARLAAYTAHVSLSAWVELVIEAHFVLAESRAK